MIAQPGDDPSALEQQQIALARQQQLAASIQLSVPQEQQQQQQQHIGALAEHKTVGALTTVGALVSPSAMLLAGSAAARQPSVMSYATAAEDEDISDGSLFDSLSPDKKRPARSGARSLS